MGVEASATLAIDCGLEIPRRIGPGLLESAYEAILAATLERRSLRVERQRMIAIHYEGLRIDAGFRADLIGDDTLLIELKSIDRRSPVHGKQVLSSCAFLSCP